jgi:hypothetical protein
LEIERQRLELELKRLELDQKRFASKMLEKERQHEKDSSLLAAVKGNQGKERRLAPNHFTKDGYKWPPRSFSFDNVVAGIVPGFISPLLDWCKAGIMFACGEDPDITDTFGLTGDWLGTVITQIKLQLNSDCAAHDTLVIWLDTVRDGIAMAKLHATVSGGSGTGLRDVRMWHMLKASFYEKFALMNANSWATSVLEFVPEAGESASSFIQRFYSHYRLAHSAVGSAVLPDSQVQGSLFRGLELFYQGANTELANVLQAAERRDGINLVLSPSLSGCGAPVMRCDSIDIVVRYALQWLTECGYKPTSVGLARMNSRVPTIASAKSSSRGGYAGAKSSGMNECVSTDCELNEVQKDDTCRNFVKTGTCRWGSKCRFRHTSSSSSSPSSSLSQHNRHTYSTPSTSSSSSTPSTSSSSSTSSTSSLPCVQWAKGYCMYGTNCKFSHTRPCDNCDVSGHPWALCPSGYVNARGELKVAVDNGSFLKAKQGRIDWAKNQVLLMHPQLPLTSG